MQFGKVMQKIRKIDILCRRVIEGLRERTEHLSIFLFFRPSLNRVLFPMFRLLVEGEILVSDCYCSKILLVKY